MPDKEERYCYLLMQGNKGTPHEVKHGESILILACTVVCMQVDLALWDSKNNAALKLCCGTFTNI